MCGSLRRPPECNKQGIPARTPQVGQGTASKVFGGMSPILIRKRYHRTSRKTVRFGTLLKLAFPNGPNPPNDSESSAATSSSSNATLSGQNESPPIGGGAALAESHPAASHVEIHPGGRGRGPRFMFIGYVYGALFTYTVLLSVPVPVVTNFCPPNSRKRGV